MDRIEFIKEWFYKEEERKHSLNDSLNIPIGILTALIALISYIFNEFNSIKENVYIIYPFYFFFIISMLFWFVSTFKLLQSYNDLYKGYAYLGFPKPSFLKDENLILKDYLEKNKEHIDENTNLANLEKDSLETLLIQCLETNVYNNDKKSAYLHSSKIHMINCLISIVFSSVFFTINFIGYKNEKIQKIEIINYNSRNMAQDEKKPMAPRPPQQQPRVIKQSEKPRQSPPPKPPKPSN